MSRLNWIFSGVSDARTDVTMNRADRQKAAVREGIGEKGRGRGNGEAGKRRGGKGNGEAVSRAFAADGGA